MHGGNFAASINTKYRLAEFASTSLPCFCNGISASGVHYNTFFSDGSFCCSVSEICRVV